MPRIPASFIGGVIPTLIFTSLFAGATQLNAAAAEHSGGIHQDPSAAQPLEFRVSVLRIHLRAIAESTRLRLLNVIAATTLRESDVKIGGMSAKAKRRVDTKRTSNPPKLVWHYTGFAGLDGILRGNIWASSAAYLNDTKEFRYAIELAAEAFKAQIDTHSAWRAEDITDEHMARYRMAQQLRTNVGRMFTGVQGTDVFVASFSTKQDHLSQWRAYGGAGASFSVGFDAKMLSAKAGEAGFVFAHVKYGRAQVRRELDRLLRPRVRAAFDEKIPKLTYQNVNDVRNTLVDDLRQLAAVTKHESFADEAEWRLVRRMPLRGTPNPLIVKFRPARSLVVPYVEIPLHEPWPEIGQAVSGNAPVVSPIRAINIGPSPHPKELKYAVEKMVLLKGFTNVVVTCSEAPFRDW